MDFIESNYNAGDGKDYYEIAVNLQTHDTLLIKNSSCLAEGERIACEHWNVANNGFTYKTIKVFSVGTDPNKISERIPKKYQKIVFKNEW